MAVIISASGVSAFDVVKDSGKIVKGADWEKMETILVRINEMEYEPADLVFKAGQAYKLQLLNIGKKKHYFTAPEFYQAIATRKIQSDQDGEIKVPYIKALEMMAEGGKLDVYFVPVVKGTYKAYCTIDDHQKEGMEGSITIE